MGLFRPAWESRNSKKALKAVAKMTDQEKIKKAATGRVLIEVMTAAVAKLTDQKLLADIAKDNTQASETRMAAIRNLTDQVTLEMIAEDCSGEKEMAAELAKAQKAYNKESEKVCYSLYLDKLWLRVEAAAKLTDQNSRAAQVAYAEYVKLTKDGAGHFVYKITDQAILADVAKNARSWEAHDHAVHFLTEQELLADVAISGAFAGANSAAARKLTDQALIEKVAENACDSEVREDAAKMLFRNNTKFIVKLITIENDVNVCLALFDKLSGVEKETVRQMLIERFCEMGIHTYKKLPERLSPFEPCGHSAQPSYRDQNCVFCGKHR